jgi:hypothetical protein
MAVGEVAGRRHRGSGWRLEGATWQHDDDDDDGDGDRSMAAEGDGWRWMAMQRSAWVRVG